MELIVQVRDKSKVGELKELGDITHISKYLNMVIIEVSPSAILKLKAHPNIVSFKEGEKGTYKTDVLFFRKSLSWCIKVFALLL